MKQVSSAYKCRFCNTLFRVPMPGIVWDDKEKQFAVLKNWEPPQNKMQHDCSAQKIGFADLIGYEAVEEFGA